MEANDQEKLRQEVDEVLHGSKQPAAPQMFAQNDYSNVRHVIGVVSGKGGVGKSLVCGVLAVEPRAARRARWASWTPTSPAPRSPHDGPLRRAGARRDELLVPIKTKGGIEVMSANLVLEHETDPVLWRGPVIAGAIKQFWGGLRLGRARLPARRHAPGDRRRAAHRLPVAAGRRHRHRELPAGPGQDGRRQGRQHGQHDAGPVLGLVENMAYVECPHCGEKIYPLRADPPPPDRAGLRDRGAGPAAHRPETRRGVRQGHLRGRPSRRDALRGRGHRGQRWPSSWTRCAGQDA